MNLQYAVNESLTPEELEELFLSVHWLSGYDPQTLARAIANASMVFTVRHQRKLIALASTLDDGVLTAYLHHLLVHRDYQGLGVGKILVKEVKKHYKYYPYLLVIPEEKRNMAFFEKLGFEQIENVIPMQNKDILF